MSISTVLFSTATMAALLMTNCIGHFSLGKGIIIMVHSCIIFGKPLTLQALLYLTSLCLTGISVLCRHFEITSSTSAFMNTSEKWEINNNWDLEWAATPVLIPVDLVQKWILSQFLSTHCNIKMFYLQGNILFLLFWLWIKYQNTYT